MAGFRSNVRTVAAATFDLGHALNFRRSAGGRSLGEEARDVLAVGIQTRTAVKQLDAEGNRLADLKPSTLARKRKLGFPETIGVETREMLSLEELRGRATSTADSVAIDVGASEEAQKKTEWFSEGNKNQAARPFVGIDRDTERALDALAEESLDREIRRSF